MKITALLLAFYLFVGSLFPRMDFGQLAKVGNVFEHYAKHRAETENQAVSFVDFVWAHFIQPTAHDGQHSGNDHQELPFQSLSSSFVFAVYYCCMPAEAHPVVLPDDVAFHYAGLLLNDIPNSFFHPPAHPV